MSFGKPDQNSIRPPPDSSEKGSGPRAKGVIAGQTSTANISTVQARVPVYPVADPVGPKDEQEGEEIEALDEEEQADVPLCLPTQYQPTRSEFLDHCVTHYPYRAWCSHCREGRGQEFGHDCQSGTKEPRASPVVSFDYAFVSDHGEVTSQEGFEAAGDGAVKILVVRDSRSKAVFAHVVPHKGLDEKGFAVDALVSDVNGWAT